MFFQKIYNLQLNKAAVAFRVHGRYSTPAGDQRSAKAVKKARATNLLIRFSTSENVHKGKPGNARTE